MHLQVLRELSNVTVKPTSITFGRLWWSRGAHEGLEENKWQPYLQERHIVESRELQFSQPHISLVDGDRVNNTGNLFQTHKKGD